MRVIVPFAVNQRNGTGGLQEATRRALEGDGIDAEYIDVSGSQTAYHELLLRLWADGQGFVNIEHDIVVRPGLVAEFVACPEPWCGSPYSIGTSLGSYLGCVRFSDAMVQGYPDAVRAIDRLPWDGTERRYWGRLDTRLIQVLTDQYHLVQHLHWPAVEHLNPTKTPPTWNCRCGQPIPFEIVASGPGPHRCPLCMAEQRE